MIDERLRPPGPAGGPIPLWRRLSERLYTLGVDLRARHAPAAVKVPQAAVLSVGNLEAGGTGKTPCVLWWARRLAHEGKTAVVCRPYGPPAGGHPSDEIAEFAESLPAEVLLAHAARKLDAALRAAQAGAEFIVIDDGFSHRAVARDIDLLLLDARHPLGNGHLLPAGTLRERPGAVARADGVVLSRADRASASQRDETRRRVRALGFTGPILEARHRPVGLRQGDRVLPLDSRRVYCASGLGRPRELAEAAGAAGLEVAGERSFGDHHRFSEAQWRQLERSAQERSAALLVSHKDAVRLGAAQRERALVLEIEWEWLAGEVDPSWLVEKLVGARAR